MKYALAGLALLVLAGCFFRDHDGDRGRSYDNQDQHSHFDQDRH